MSDAPHIPGLRLTDHEFEVPLDHARGGPTITIFAREAVAVGKERADLPWLLFLQGGPGGKSPRPTVRAGWVRRATEEFRVLLLDQRGTGRSTPATRQTLARVGGPREQAEYMAHFRADSIVRDAELIRAKLSPGRPWSALGQSYGGFCALTYLSIAPEGLREVLITGGLAPLERSADEVYRATYRRVLEQNRRFFARYPGDRARVDAVAQHIASRDVRLPSGDRLTLRSLQTLGMMLGASDGFEQLHYMLDEAFVEGARGPELSDTFLGAVQGATSFAHRPLYALMHESIYAQGAATRWAAERIRDEYGEFDTGPRGPVLFTGEMIYPWMFEDEAALRPLNDVAELLAEREGWPPLYDVARLRQNTVPVAATVYADDMYVERAFAEETARTVGSCRIWLTNEYQHDALRADGDRVLSRLIAMARGEA